MFEEKTFKTITRNIFYKQALKVNFEITVRPQSRTLNLRRNNLSCISQDIKSSFYVHMRQQCTIVFHRKSGHYCNQGDQNITMIDQYSVTQFHGKTFSGACDIKLITGVIYGRMTEVTDNNFYNISHGPVL